MSTVDLSRACAALAVWLMSGLAVAQPAPSEPAVKAAFLYKFAGYVDWTAPAQPDAPFVIATIGADEVADELTRLLPGRAVAGRPAVVRTLRAGESLDGVQILFIGRRTADVRATIRAAQKHGVLTVTENGLEAGAVINFIVAESRVTFEVSLDAAERSGHRISSRMLAVARRVVSRGAL